MMEKEGEGEEERKEGGEEAEGEGQEGEGEEERKQRNEGEGKEERKEGGVEEGGRKVRGPSSRKSRAPFSFPSCAVALNTCRAGSSSGAGSFSRDRFIFPGGFLSPGRAFHSSGPGSYRCGIGPRPGTGPG